MSGDLTRAELETMQVAAGVNSLTTIGFWQPHDGGGDGYVRAAGLPTSTGWFRSLDRYLPNETWDEANGGYWALKSFKPYPETFGAVGDGATDDHQALQDWIDYVRAFKMLGYLRAGKTYLTSLALDATTNGSTYGWGFVGEGGPLKATIIGNLSEPYPVLDTTGNAYLLLRGFNVYTTNGQATCAWLHAKAYQSIFHNANPTVRDCKFDCHTTSARACVIMQNGDTALFDNTQISSNTGEGLVVGGSLPVLRSGVAQAATSNSVTLDASASPIDGTYVGETIKIFSGPGAGQVNTITSYSGATKVATVAANWSTSPTSASKFEIYAIRSKFRTLGGDFDGTHPVSTAAVAGSDLRQAA